MRVMAAPRKYPDELRERVTRMAVDARRGPATRTGALTRIGEQLGINPETLRNWVIQAEIDEGHRPGTTTDDATRGGFNAMTLILTWLRACNLSGTGHCSSVRPLPARAVPG